MNEETDWSAHSIRPDVTKAIAEWNGLDGATYPSVPGTGGDIAPVLQ